MLARELHLVTEPLDKRRGFIPSGHHVQTSRVEESRIAHVPSKPLNTIGGLGHDPIVRLVFFLIKKESQFMKHQLRREEVYGGEFVETPSFFIPTATVRPDRSGLVESILEELTLLGNYACAGYTIPAEAITRAQSLLKDIYSGDFSLNWPAPLFGESTGGGLGIMWKRGERLIEAEIEANPEEDRYAIRDYGDPERHFSSPDAAEMRGLLNRLFG